MRAVRHVGATLAVAALATAAACNTKEAAVVATEDDPAPAVAPDRAVAVGERAPADPAVGAAPAGYLKGSTHVHTASSKDSSTPVERVVAWYEKRGYDFIVVTDHDVVTDYEHDGALLVIPGVELTYNPSRCTEPRPEPGQKCRIHVNALFVTERPEGEIEWKERGSTARIDKYTRALDTVEHLGGLAQINHPTWYWGMNAELLAEIGRRGAGLVEIGNAQFKIWNRGNERHPAVEQLWDDVLTAGVTMWGVASDDAHHYHGYGKYPAGGGWVMVRAERTPESIRAALARGDFYSSSGVVLQTLAVEDGALIVRAAKDADHEFSFIGAGGAVLAESRGREARYTLADAPPGYVRAVVTGPRGGKAWTQPVAVP